MRITCSLSESNAARAKDRYDDIAGAAPPRPEGGPTIRGEVTTSMIHGACGSMIPAGLRAADGVFANGRPVRFRLEAIEIDGPQAYNRPGCGRSILKIGVLLTNHWAAPRRQWMCAQYNAYINVGVGSSVANAKYMRKYGFKRADRAAVELWKVGSQ